MFVNGDFVKKKQKYNIIFENSKFLNIFFSEETKAQFKSYTINWFVLVKKYRLDILSPEENSGKVIGLSDWSSRQAFTLPVVRQFRQALQYFEIILWTIS
jgi:hypothetical protein